MRLVSQLDRQRYSPRLYIISVGDSLSLRKLQQFEPDDKVRGFFGYSIIANSLRLSWIRQCLQVAELPRARRVHQSLFSAPWTTFGCLLAALKLCIFTPALKRQHFADILLLNGPGTCVPLAAACLLSNASSCFPLVF